MNAPHIYEAFSASIFLYLNSIWKNDWPLNLILKIIFIGLGIWGLFILCRG